MTATLAIGFATLWMAVSMVVHAKLRSEAPSKLSRAPSGPWSRRRREAAAHRADCRIRYRDRVIHVPVDELGRVLNPDTSRP